MRSSARFLFTGVSSHSINVFPALTVALRCIFPSVSSFLDSHTFLPFTQSHFLTDHRIYDFICTGISAHDLKFSISCLLHGKCDIPPFRHFSATLNSVIQYIIENGHHVHFFKSVHPLCIYLKINLLFLTDCCFFKSLYVSRNKRKLIPTP